MHTKCPILTCSLIRASLINSPFVSDNPDPAEVHSPFTPIMLSRFLSCLVIIAYHIHHDDME